MASPPRTPLTGGYLVSALRVLLVELLVELLAVSEGIDLDGFAARLAAQLAGAVERALRSAWDKPPRKVLDDIDLDLDETSACPRDQIQRPFERLDPAGPVHLGNAARRCRYLYQLLRSQNARNGEPHLFVQLADPIQFVRICQMMVVPCNQDIAPMV